MTVLSEFTNNVLHVVQIALKETTSQTIETFQI